MDRRKIVIAISFLDCASIILYKKDHPIFFFRARHHCHCDNFFLSHHLQFLRSNIFPLAADACTAGPSNFGQSIFCYNGDNCTHPVEPNAGSRMKLSSTSSYFDGWGRGEFSLPTAKDDLDGPRFSPTNVAVCFCPQIDECNVARNVHFSQQIGTVHFFISKVCRSDDMNCAIDYTGTTPNLFWKLRVECPKGACREGQNKSQRMKVVAPNPERGSHDLPQWHVDNLCRTAEHGKDWTGKTIWDVGVRTYYAHNSLHGTGLHVPSHIKDFRPYAYVEDDPLSTMPYRSRFKFDVASNNFEGLSFITPLLLDVCYCESMCSMAEWGNWFKVGQVRLSSYRPMSEIMGDGEDATSTQAIQYVHEPGNVIIETGTKDGDVMGLSGGGIINFINDPNADAGDRECRNNFDFYDPALIDVAGLKNETAATHYKGIISDSRLVFNSGSTTNVIELKRAGIVGVCFCAFTEQYIDHRPLCKRSDYWVFMYRFTVKGPTAGHTWKLSTHTVFHLEYRGFGLTDDNILRIISNDGKCSDNGRNPDKASFADTYVQVGAPEEPSNVGNVTDVVNGDLQTWTLSSRRFDCNNKFEKCTTNDIVRIVVLSDTETEVTFEVPPLLDPDGEDVLTLGENVECDPVDNFDCNDEKLMLLKGEFDYRDKETNKESAPDTFMVGHKVKPTNDPLVWRLQVGFKCQWDFKCQCCRRPPFVVVYVNQRRAQWARRNRAVTKWEIQGLRERTNLRVCWNYYGPNQNNFVAEVGLLTLIPWWEPTNPMVDARVSLTTWVTDVKAPMIVSFRTAGNAIGHRYSKIDGQMQLRLSFLDTSRLDVHFSDELASAIDNNASEDEIHEARQYICGKLFKELWSDDAELGFPLPKGCYYRTYGYLRELELSLLFEEKSGLKAGQVLRLNEIFLCFVEGLLFR